MRRREFLTLAGVAAFPFGVRAQTTRIPRIAVFALPKNPEPFWTEFRNGLRDLGYVEGRNVHVELRTGEGDAQRLSEQIADAVQKRFDILAVIQTAPALIAKKATTEIPIVMVSAGDPVGTGIVTNLARPEGNITGMSASASGTTIKTFEILREMVPSLKRVAALVNGADPVFGKTFLEQIQLAGRQLSIEVRPITTQSHELEAAFSALAKERIDAVIIQPSLPFAAGDLALKHRLPMVAANSRFAAAGCVMTYSQDIADTCRKAAGYVDKILKGAKPADLPIQQPTKFELIINQKVARAVGIKVPQSVLVRADKVIE